jgi:hypothetical protein
MLGSASAKLTPERIQSQLETEMPDQAANLAPEVRFD